MDRHNKALKNVIRAHHVPAASDFIRKKTTNLVLLVLIFTVSGLHASEYGNQIEELPVNITELLARTYAPNASGAIGRNKKAYFHVRFQRGMHHVADHALATNQPDTVDRFLTAVEYSLQRQLASGDFELVIPDTMRHQGKPSVTDRASGVAFFASSLGLGLLALETNDWFKTSAECASQRSRLSAIKAGLHRTLRYLVEHQQQLELADRRAPNRLLFDAIAYVTLGILLDDDDALSIGSAFVTNALAQVHHEEGYFIEGNGHDSSYNGVATALALRLLMIQPQQVKHESVSLQAIDWQTTRINASGAISTAGNSRVRPGGGGESFLGREKDVDVGHTVEALMLASHLFSNRAYGDLAMRVIGYHSNRR